LPAGRGPDDDGLLDFFGVAPALDASRGGAVGTEGASGVLFAGALPAAGFLAAVVGSIPLPRTEVTKKIWDYIKKNKLQDAVNRRLINADEKLKAVFGGKGKVSMFEMTKLVSNHLK
jgi:hypothetical protein